jgi:hypothetical protein
MKKQWVLDCTEETHILVREIRKHTGFTMRTILDMALAEWVDRHASEKTLVGKGLIKMQEAKNGQ